MSINGAGSSLRLPPYRLVRAIDAFRSLLLRIHRRIFPGNVVLYEFFQHFWLLPALKVAAELDVAGALAVKPRTAEELAAELKVNAPALSRVLRALTGHGIFRQRKDGRYILTPVSKAMLDGPGSLRHMILHHLGQINWDVMSSLNHTVLTGEDAFTARYGMPTYRYLQSHPEEYALFEQSMSDLSDLGLAPILASFDFGKFGTVADIGGGEGFLLGHVLRQHPGLAGKLFDTAEALVKAPDFLGQLNVNERVEIVAGDFFRSVPDGCDLYILKNILHNWNDEDCIRILQAVGKAAPVGGRILVVEMVVPEGNAPSLAKLLDIQMMATMAGGCERTSGEFRALLEKGGWSVRRIIPTVAPISLIEAGLLH